MIRHASVLNQLSTVDRRILLLGVLPPRSTEKTPSEHSAASSASVLFDQRADSSSSYVILIYSGGCGNRERAT
jgi:hypothetical protein